MTGSGEVTVAVSSIAPMGQEFSVTDDIETDETWLTGNTYILLGRIKVNNGATLTIEPGVVVKGAAGVEANAKALIITRGSKIMAMGTATSPIIFTSTTDDIEPGEISSPNLDENDVGGWGGLIVLGNAPISADAVEVQIEGIPAADTDGLYGGTDAADNSGVIQYVSIRHGGANIGEGNEINGLTLGGVGSGTTIDHIEVVANADDGIEFFGGTVNVTNALVWAQQDDAFDIDQAYSGTVDNFVYIAGEDSDHGLEIDGPEGSESGSFTLMNGTLKGLSAEYADFRDGATGTVKDCYFFNFSTSADLELDANGSEDANGDDVSDNPVNSDNFANGELVLTGLEFSDIANDDAVALTLEGIFSDKWSKAPAANGFDPNDSRTEADAADQGAANEATFVAGNSMVSTATKGADTSEFDSWTFASDSGALDF